MLFCKSPVGDALIRISIVTLHRTAAPGAEFYPAPCREHYGQRLLRFGDSRALSSKLLAIGRPHTSRPNPEGRALCDKRDSWLAENENATFMALVERET